MKTIVEETEKLTDEISNITSNGECLETEIWYSGANNYNMNTSYVYKLGDKYYSVWETYNEDTYQYEEGYADITEEYSKEVEEKEKLTDEISNITSNGECLETEIWYSGANNYNMNTSYVYKLGDKYYSVWETYNEDTYQYEEGYSLISDYNGEPEI